MDNIWIYLIIVAVTVLLVLILLHYFRQWRIVKSGKDGEKKVASALARFAGIRNFKVINDIYLPLYDKTTQIDHILIGFFGMIVIETKNYKGDIYGDPRSKKWMHVVGNDRNDMYNPLMQNQAHIDCIRHILAKANIYNIKIDSLIVFVRKKTGLYVPKGLPIIRLNKLRKFLKQSKYEKDNNVDVELLYKTITESAVTDKKLIAKHNRNVKEMAKH